MTTELDPKTHAPINHDAERRKRELDFMMEQINNQAAPNSEVPPTQAPVAHTVSVDDLPQVASAPAPVEPSVDWQHEAETYKKRFADATRALTPSQQKAALLSKEIKEERENNAAALRQLQEQLAEIKASIVSNARREDVAPVYRPEDDPDFARENPDVAERFSLLTKSFNQRLEQVQQEASSKIAAIEERHLRTQKAVEEERQQLYVQNWDKELRRLVPDIDSFMPGAIHGQALVDWGMTIAPEYARAISDPYAHTPQFVAQVINAFKTSNGIVPVNGRRPSLGDLANPSLTGSSRVTVEVPEPANLLTDYQMANIKDLVDQAFRDKNHKLGNDLMDRYQKTLLSKQR